jgi:two-component system, chemotaxis family, protein-glutamate methylesterase/glutaminase
MPCNTPILQYSNTPSTPAPMKQKTIQKRYDIVVMGVSSGGMAALSTIIPMLSKDFVLPVVIVQHQHPHADDFLVRYLNEKCELSVKLAEEKESIEPATVYLAPPNYHLLIEQDRTFSLSIAARVNYARPSVDVLFETAADAFGANTIGIILTGANNDGSQGLKMVHDCGGLAIVQDPATAEATEMPRAAIAATNVDHIVPLAEIGHILNSLSKG